MNVSSKDQSIPRMTKSERIVALHWHAELCTMEEIVQLAESSAHIRKLFTLRDAIKELPLPVQNPHPRRTDASREDERTTYIPNEEK